jgi:hypothetical protein
VEIEEEMDYTRRVNETKPEGNEDWGESKTYVTRLIYYTSRLLRERLEHNSTFIMFASSSY